MNEINLLRRIARNFSKTSHLDYEDLFSEACWIYCKALKTYDPSRGKITTYVWWMVTSELKTYINLQAKHLFPLQPLETAKQKEVPVSSFFDSLTTEAFIIAKIILASPTPFITRTPEDAEERIQEIMSKRGWGIEKIVSGIANLKYVCNH